MEQESPCLGRCSSGKAGLGETIRSNLLPCLSPQCNEMEREHLSSGLAPPRALTPKALLLGLEPLLGAVGGCHLCPLEMLGGHSAGAWGPNAASNSRSPIDQALGQTLGVRGEGAGVAFREP